MTNLPFDIIENILRRLPVKSLKRFRAVAKPWCVLIDSDRFVDLHLRHSTTSLSNRHLIVGWLREMRTTALDSLDKPYAIHPPSNCKSGDRILHSCNGIVLVIPSPKLQPPVLWNPFSRDYKTLPDSPFECADPDFSYTEVGYLFGYASKNDDYKVIRLAEFKDDVLSDDSLGEETKIYSLKSNLWRRIEPLPNPHPEAWHTHVNGVLHMLVKEPDDGDVSRIMCFNLETEEIYPMMMPYGIESSDGIESLNDVSLDVTGDYLSVVCSNSHKVVIWVMKNYGLVESWVKLVSISSPVPRNSCYVQPLVCSKEGDKVLLLEDFRFAWYDVRTESVENVHVDGLPSRFYAQTIVESLVSVGGDRRKEGLKTGGEKEGNEE